MLLYAILHIVWIITSIIGGIIEHPNISWFFLFGNCLLDRSGFWLLYILFEYFFESMNLFITRLTFCTYGLIWVLCLFAYFYNCKNIDTKNTNFSYMIVYGYIYHIYHNRLNHFINSVRLCRTGLSWSIWKLV